SRRTALGRAAGAGVALAGASHLSRSTDSASELGASMNPNTTSNMTAVLDTPAMAGYLTQATAYRTKVVDGRSIFYREAGDPAAPTILLLPGFPSSSHMFRDLIPLLADRVHLVAPDYLGYGHSDAPSATEFAYTFDHLADLTERFVDALGLARYSLYLQDYGGPVGFRLATRRPERVQALIIQNTNAYGGGLTPAAQPLATAGTQP